MVRILKSVCLCLTLAAAGCMKPKPKPPPPPCTCGEQICGAACDGTLDCGTCPANGVCSADGLSCRAALAVGSPCTTALDCGEPPLVCLGTGDGGLPAPDGYCSAPCSATSPCPAGATCGLDVQGNHVCLATCTNDSGCRGNDGYSCELDAGVCQACVASCAGKTCGDDGCGGSCGISTPGAPACSTTGTICSAGNCESGFLFVTDLPPNDYPSGLWDATALDLNGQIGGGGIALIGGRQVVDYSNSNNVMTYGSRGIPNIEIYYPDSQGGAGTFSDTFPALPSPLARANAVVYQGLLYVVGGTNEMITRDGPVESPDPTFYSEVSSSSGNGPPVISWATDRAPLPVTPVNYSSIGSGVALIDYLIYVVVGQTDPANQSSTSNLVASYDLRQYTAGPDGGSTPSDLWNTTEIPNRPTSRSFAATVTDGTSLYVIGGSDGQNALGTVEVYDPKSETWSTWPPLPVPVVDPRAAVAGDYIYVFGGQRGLNPNCCQSPYVQSIYRKTGDTQLVGSTYQGLTGQAPVVLQNGRAFLFGAKEFDNLNELTEDNDVLQFLVPQRP
jgi:hypothetical protein